MGLYIVKKLIKQVNGEKKIKFTRNIWTTQPQLHANFKEVHNHADNLNRLKNPKREDSVKINC